MSFGITFKTLLATSFLYYLTTQQVVVDAEWGVGSGLSSEFRFMFLHYYKYLCQ